MERELDSPDGWLFSNSFLADLSGGGQGKGKQPREKIQGTQHRWREEKVKNIPKPFPKIRLPFPFPKPKPK